MATGDEYNVFSFEQDLVEYLRSKQPEGTADARVGKPALGSMGGDAQRSDQWCVYPMDETMDEGSQKLKLEVHYLFPYDENRVGRYEELRKLLCGFSPAGVKHGAGYNISKVEILYPRSPGNDPEFVPKGRSNPATLRNNVTLVFSLEVSR